MTELLSPKQLQYLDAMGVTVWQEKDSRLRGNDDHINEDDNVNWQDLQQQIAACSMCELHKTRTNTVFGVGNEDADLLIVGEAPGANEDAKGEPFVGRAGLLLNEMLKAIGLSRDDVFIANVLKCRPPQNRDPSSEEVALCTPYLSKQIEHIKPKLIVAVGRIAAHFLLNTNETMGKLRGQIFHYGEQQVPLLVTYHPAYLLRSPREKAKAYDDILKIKGMLPNISFHV